VNTQVQEKISSYPGNAKSQLECIRSLILKVADENNLGAVEETFKWGEPSYLVNGGSTIRIDWKPKEPDVVKVYFHCQTSLLETFKELYQDELEFDGKRAIVISLDMDIDKCPLDHCIELALRYHSLKHLPLLGA
jgi:hypothetical protein|tara:strand:- start:17137 stop:17541 length:405 start_codon:yes stop_codon:yes gene_type:complete